MFDIVVIGAGTVGLAIARRFALEKRSVLVVERHAVPGQETSSRSSEVIHAGIYYAPGSLKARLCVAGRQQLIEYARARHIDHKLTGKLIVAVDEAGEQTLEAIRFKARQNGVDLPDILSSAQAHELEPAVQCRAALLSPGTGIIDSHGLLTALHGDVQDLGGTLVFHHAVEQLRPWQGGWQLDIRDRDGRFSQVEAALVVNAAGLDAIRVARQVEGERDRPLPEPSPCRGNYFAYSGKLGISRLIYPTPEPGGLGIHLTLDLNGQIRFGPDVEYLPEAARQDYRVNEQRRPLFVEAIRRYLPQIEPDRLTPDYSGIRPKVSWRGEILTDFMIQNGADRDLDGLIELFGIESPGLTACLAIADEVLALAEDRG